MLFGHLFFQEYHQSVKQFRSRSGPIYTAIKNFKFTQFSKVGSIVAMLEKEWGCTGYVDHK